MTFDMVCSCGSSLHLDAELMDDMLWVFVNRFANAHVICGYMSPLAQDKKESRRNVDIQIKDMGQ